MGRVGHGTGGLVLAWLQIAGRICAVVASIAHQTFALVAVLQQIAYDLAETAVLARRIGAIELIILTNM